MVFPLSWSAARDGAADAPVSNLRPIVPKIESELGLSAGRGEGGRTCCQQQDDDKRDRAGTARSGKAETAGKCGRIGATENEPRRRSKRNRVDLAE